MLFHKGTVILETDRLLLRKFKDDDAEDMFRNWANDNEVTKYLSWKPHGNLDITKEIVHSWVYSYKNSEFYNWAIILKSYGKAIGSLSAVNISNGFQRCEIGYCLSKTFWNKGIMSETVKLVLNYLVINVGFKRVQAIHHPDNHASGQVMLKAGMKYEGRLRKYLLNNQGVLEDCKMYAITDKDLEKVRIPKTFGTKPEVRS